MILLRPDCLEFKLGSGEAIPCSAEQVTVELLGESAQLLDEDVVKQAAASVLHYFRNEMGQTTVSVAEFSSALERVLRGLGFQVTASQVQASQEDQREVDLRRVALNSEPGMALTFFPKLRDELRGLLGGAPQVVRFRGLRGCVKLLADSERWTSRCDALSDEIVEYIRVCLWTERGEATCSVVID